MSELLERIVGKQVNSVNDNMLGGDANAAHALFLGVAMNRGAKERTAHAVLDAIINGRNNNHGGGLTYTDLLLSEFDRQCGGDCELSPRLNRCRTVEAALKVLMAHRRNERLVYNSDRTLFLGYIAGRAAAAPPVPAD